MGSGAEGRAPIQSGHMLQKVPVSLRFTCFIHAWLLFNYVNYVSVDMHRHGKPIWIHFYMLMRSRYNKALVDKAWSQ